MRPIETQTDREQKQKRNQILIGIILIALMVFSTLGYAAFNGFGGNNDGSFKYNGFKFKNVNGLWTTNINGADYFFLYKPQEVNKRELILNPLNYYYNKPLYINSDNFEAQQEITRNFYYISESIREACLKGEDCNNENLPIKTCEDNFIIIKEGENKIVQDKNCVFISGEFDSLVSLTNEFLYKLLDIV
ncbi:MAG: hypothetical protein AABY22_08915 [Nanoarchaeota archaeon]